MKLCKNAYDHFNKDTKKEKVPAHIASEVSTAPLVNRFKATKFKKPSLQESMGSNSTMSVRSRSPIKR